MDKFPDKAIIWVDCDAVINRYPTLFDLLSIKNIDFAAYYRNWKHNKNELLGGTLFFKNSELIQNILKRWNRFNLKHPNIWGQKNLQKIIKKYSHLLNIAKLPIAYCAIFDDLKITKIEPVITHYQASRKYRKKIRMRSRK
jgi:hypothetical protein